MVGKLIVLTSRKIPTIKSLIGANKSEQSLLCLKIHGLCVHIGGMGSFISWFSKETVKENQNMLPSMFFSEFWLAAIAMQQEKEHKVRN